MREIVDSARETVEKEGKALETERFLPREKLRRLGVDSLSDGELLSILLRTGVRGVPVQTVANTMLAAFQGKLEKLSEAGVEELSQINGVGKIKALELTAAFALSRRIARNRFANRPEMSNPQLVADYMYGILEGNAQEEFHVLMLDTGCRLIRQERISLGLVDRSFMHPREVYRVAIRELSSRIIVCHNHPAGSLRPSKNDLEATRRLLATGEIIGIPLVDHIIVGCRQPDGKIGYFSFKESGLLTEGNE